MAGVLDGKVVAEGIKKNLYERIKKSHPTLAVVLVGDNPASKVYITNKQKACAEVGIHSILKQFPADTTHDSIVDWLDSVGDMERHIHGILVQLPLPEKFDQNFILQRVKPNKDVDCFHPENQGLLMAGKPLFQPCTPAGIVALLKHYHVSIRGAHVVIINNTIVVGRPLSMMLSSEATVTICHRYTKNLKEICQQADIIVTAVGDADPNYRLTANMVREGAIVVDVGIHRDGKKIRGDAIFEDIVKKAWITPVPGGVGPCTVAMLLSNTVDAWERTQ